ncbi:hypothetical protein M1116_01905 [Patescibacteria group bacterium]|nr:hypothetical protein [Patescibacteria group bacterium]
MKIKSDEKQGISYLLRKLILNEELGNVVRYIYEKRTEINTVSVYLPLANKRMNEIAENPNLHDEGFDSCFEKDDCLLIDELIRLQVLARPKEFNYCEDDDGSFIATVVVKNPSFIEHLYEWINDKKLIISYGIFCLHTFTGEAYCLDNRYDFDTNDGLYRIFKAFLEEPTHVLSYLQIINKFLDDEVKDCDELRVQQAIYNIKRKLNMDGELSKLFLAADKKYYLRTK